jgi:hypothetical protein
MFSAFQPNAFQNTAFQIGVIPNAGSGISGGHFEKHRWIPYKHWTKNDYRRFKEQLAREALAEANKNRGLTALNIAERDMALCEAECAKHAQAFSQFPSRQGLDLFNRAIERLEGVTDKLAVLRRDEADENAKSEKARLAAEKALVAKEQDEAAAHSRLRLFVQNALSAGQGMAHMAQQLAHLHLTEAAFRERQRVAQEAARDSDDDDLSILLLH